jgi:hypothetical protein
MRGASGSWPRLRIQQSANEWIASAYGRARFAATFAIKALSPAASASVSSSQVFLTASYAPIDILRDGDLLIDVSGNVPVADNYHVVGIAASGQ